MHQDRQKKILANSAPSLFLRELWHASSDKCASEGGICCGPNLTCQDHDSCPVVGTWRISQDPHPGISTTSKSDSSPHHNAEAILTSEDISRPRVWSHTAAHSWLDFGPNVPSRGDFIYHHRQIEANFFVLQNLLDDFILFIVQNHLTVKQSTWR